MFGAKAPESSSKPEDRKLLGTEDSKEVKPLIPNPQP